MGKDVSGQLLTTDDVPKKLLKSAFLVGKVPFKAAMVDQRVSYCMYIPEKRYRAADKDSKLPLITIVHGTSRRAETCRDLMVDLADRQGVAILAPLFPAGVEDPNDIHNYKAIRYHDIRYDLILLGIIDEVKQRWPTISTEKIFLAGFSGGGQFCLRFLYLHPERIEAASIGAPGSVTHLNRYEIWPEGLQDVQTLFEGLDVDIDQIKAIKKIQLVIGANDNKVPGGGLLHWLEQNPDLKVQRHSKKAQITNRKEAVIALHEEFNKNEIVSQIDLMPDTGHDMEKVLPKMIEFLEQCLKS